MSKLLPLEENVLPESVVLMTGPESVIVPLSTRFGHQHKVFQPISAVEVKSVLSALFSKIHK